jgi:outer membrane protein assembly factor BamB
MAEGTTMQIHCLPALLLLTVNLSVSAADNWPRYRGPDAMGVAEDAQLPDAWDTSKNVEWKSDIPGRGWSSPIVWGNRVFLTTVVDSGNAEEAK